MRAWASMAALGALMAGAALAGPRYDAADLAACMEHRGPDQWHSCIGTASERCMAQPGGDTVSGSISCVLAERDDWDRLLNASYQDLRGLMRQLDSDAGVRPSEGAYEALRQMQRAWIAYRDASCGFEQAQFHGGSMGRQIAASCHMHATAEQAIRLMRNVIYQ